MENLLEKLFLVQTKIQTKIMRSILILTSVFLFSIQLYGQDIMAVGTDPTVGLQL